MITRLSWAAVQITSGDSALAIDLLETADGIRPLLGDPRSPLVAATGALDLALVTHLHPDHYEPDTLKKRLKPNARVFCDPANTEKIARDGLPAEGLALFEPVAAGPFTITALPAVDGFGDPQISFLVEAGGLKVMHFGDTLWHGHWWKIRARCGAPNVAFLPINGAITAFPRMKPSGVAADLLPDQAAAAAAILEAMLACPIHYETFHNPPIYAEWPDAEATFLASANRLGVAARRVEPGTEIARS